MSGSRDLTRITALALSATLYACDPASTPADPCAPHGESHGDHCDCDPGYREESMMCVPRTTPDAGASDAPFLSDSGVTVDAPEAGCGPNGTSHGSHCHCDSGYVEIEGRCVLPPACTGTDDTLEMNDTPETATPWSREMPTRSLYACIADEDWFRISLAAGESVRADATFMHAASDIDIYLFAPGADVEHDDPLASGDSTTDNESLSFTAAEPGDYLLLVYGYDNRESAYELALTFTPPM